MDKLKEVLKTYGLNEIQISNFLNYFEYAEKNGILHPFYYALTKVMI